jgi:hypothetical protein
MTPINRTTTTTAAQTGMRQRVCIVQRDRIVQRLTPRRFRRSPVAPLRIDALLHHPVIAHRGLRRAHG